jgi:hypothetical protein
MHIKDQTKAARIAALTVADEVAHAKIVERPVTVDEIKGLLDAAYE